MERFKLRACWPTLRAGDRLRYGGYADDDKGDNAYYDDLLLYTGREETAHAALYDRVKLRQEANAKRR